jgi:deoxyribodipyrimidine photolyase-related protein
LTRSLRFLFADQLTHELSALEGLVPERDIVLMAEVAAETDHVPHHPKKIAFLFSAMRHFAAELEAKGINVRYVTLDDPANTGSFRGEAARAVQELEPDRVIVTQPGEYRVLDDIQGWQQALGVPVEIRPDDRFLCSSDEFARWARARSSFGWSTSIAGCGPAPAG